MFIRLFSPLMLALFIVTSCAKPPDGSDVVAEIASYTYQNKPRDLPTHCDVDQNQRTKCETIRFAPGRDGAAVASSDIPWRIATDCRRDYRRWLSNTSQPVVNQDDFLKTHKSCEKKSFIGVAISGGGNKSAVYSTEVLFELKRYGLADDIDVVSSVSGGSFAAALYAVSCDADHNCDGQTWRPHWDYETIRQRMETTYFWAFVGQGLRLDNLLNGVFKHRGADDDLADVIGSRLLPPADHEITFQDLNPSRPNLILNATNVTISRGDLDRNAAIDRAFQRPWSDDEALHFSFTQQYFWRLLSDLGSYPLKEAVTASAAFPLIIDRPSLRQYHIEDLAKFRMHLKPTRTPQYVALVDGGVHDNFGVTELQWFIQCNLPTQSSWAEAGSNFYQHVCGTKKRKNPHKPTEALVFGIDSSLIRSDGVSDVEPKGRGLDAYILPVRLGGVANSVDMIMVASGEQRKQQVRRLMRDANPTNALNPAHAPHPYAQYSPDNPALRYGPYQYIDLDLGAARTLYCLGSAEARTHTPGANGAAGSVDVHGTYTGSTPSKTVVDAATGDSDYRRCEALTGVLQWNEKRNVQLPRVIKGFCLSSDDCRELEPLIGGRKLMLKYDPEKPAAVDAVDLRKVFFDPDNQTSDRLLTNTLLYDAIRDVPTDFQLAARYAWLLRYTARWVTAHRIWRLCQDNAPLLERLGKYDQACVARLPDRKLDDPVGGEAYKAANFK